MACIHATVAVVSGFGLSRALRELRETEARGRIPSDHDNQGLDGRHRGSCGGHDLELRLDYDYEKR